MDPKKAYILQLKTFPATLLCATPNMPGFTTYRKELMKIGHYDDEAGEDFDVTSETLDHWIKTFAEMKQNGNKIPIPLAHTKADDPKANAGWCLNMFRDNGTLVGSLALSNEKRELALSTDVSIFSPPEYVDANGVKYIQPITHIALTTNPSVSGLGAFKQLSLSSSKGDPDMDPKTLAKLLGLAEDADEAVITAEITKLKTPAQTIAASQGVTTVDPQFMQMVSETRTGKLDTLLNSEVITPALKDKIAKVFVESAALTLSMSKGGDKVYFDLLMEALVDSAAAKKLLGERTGPQTLALANTRAKPKLNCTQISVNKIRAASGLKPAYV